MKTLKSFGSTKAICVVIAVVALSCASPQPPSGGPPDTTPPHIISTLPKSGTTNFKDRTVTIEFDKYMDKNKVLENLFVSPVKKTSFDWSGKELDIDFEEPFDSNTTYSISFGTDYTDIYQNKPVEAFTLIFSTGSHIDSCSIKGKVYAPTVAGASVFAYKIDGLISDTLNIFHTETKYSIQLGSNGNFDLKALKPGRYRLLAIRDAYKNYVYDEPADQFGASTDDVDVDTSKIPYVMLRLGPQLDKSGPMLFDAIAAASNLIEASFSEKIDPRSLHPKAFTIQDSSGTKTVQPLCSFISLGNEATVGLALESDLDTNRKWKLTVSADTSITVRDTLGNPLPDTARTKYFMASSVKSRAVPEIVFISIKDSTQNTATDSGLTFTFNICIDDTAIDKRIEFISLHDSSKVGFSTSWAGGCRMVVTPLSVLAGNTWYRLRLRLDSLKSVYGYLAKDTTIVRSFKTIDNRSYGGISGKLIDSLGCPGKVYLSLINEDGKLSYSTCVQPDGSWAFADVPTGKYRFLAFCDSDSNGRYSYGNPYPFSHAEWFNYFDSIVNIMPRWKIEKFYLNFSK